MEPKGLVIKNRILLIDHHVMIRQGLANLINQEPDLMVCGELDSVEQAIGMIDSLMPHLAIMDISMHDIGGIEAVREMHGRYPQLPILALSSYAETDYAERVLRAGARGYATKHEGADAAMKAIRRCLRGRTYVNDAMAAELLDRLPDRRGGGRFPDISDLTDRQLEILQLLGNGLCVREIAAKLDVSAKTVEAHREHIKHKLNLKTGPALLRYAIQMMTAASEPPRSIY